MSPVSPWRLKGRYRVAILGKGGSGTRGIDRGGHVGSRRGTLQLRAFISFPETTSTSFGKDTKLTQDKAE